MASRRFVPSLVVVLLLFAPLLTTSAQGLPATPAPGSAPTGVLAEFEIDELPTPHAEVWFLRMQLDPDGSTPLGPQAGPAVLYVEAGQLMLQVDGPVSLGAGESTDPTGLATPERATDTLLETGDSLLISEGTSVLASNGTDEPVTFLFLLMYPAEREGEGEGSSQEPVGLAEQGISVGVAEFEAVPARLTIERVVVEPAGTMVTDIETPDGIWPGWMGIELGTIETGAAEVVFESRTLQNLTWPPMTGGRIEPEQIPLTATVQLDQGDGYTGFNSTLSWTSTGDEPLMVLRAVVRPSPR
jgi:hypothetical protein